MNPGTDLPLRSKTYPINSSPTHLTPRSQRSDQPRHLAIDAGFSLAETCGPVAWSKGRWPHRDWRDGEVISVGWEWPPLRSTAESTSGEPMAPGVRWRGVRADAAARLRVRGDASAAHDQAWAAAVLGIDQRCPLFDDPVLGALRQRFGGLRPLAEGSVFDGLVLAISGQSISVAAAAVTATRLATLFHPGLEVDGRRYWPLPRPDQLAAAEPALIRTSGVTWRRAEALVAAARAAVDGCLPDRAAAFADPDRARAALRALPLVGPWTTEATLLWGIGLPDAHVTGDVALLRAARRRYDRPDLTLRDLDRLADGWRPVRAWAARLLWADLFGVAPVP